MIPFVPFLDIPCDETFMVAPGVVSSPNYPENYPDDVFCRKHIMSPEGISIRLTIQDFQVEESMDCVWDSLSIYDSTGIDQLIGTYCGSELSTGAVFESTGQDMLLVFKADGSYNDKGFQAVFEFVTGK